MAVIIREPQQQRSIEKKNRIIKAGYKLFAQKGYFNTNTVEIAKEAGVSTGIVYGYFHDKRDILLEVQSLYINTVFLPVFKLFDNPIKNLDFEDLINKSLDIALEAHKNNAQIHETLHNLSDSDKEIRDRFMDLERAMTEKMVATLRNSGYENDHLYERVHWAIESIQSFCHEKIYDHHSFVDYDKMREFCVNMLLVLFEKK